MAKGSFAKEAIANKIFEVFPDAFKANDKEIRIPMDDNGELVEIKITMTCAKDIIGGSQTQSNVTTPTSAPVEPPTEEEVKEVRNIITELGL